MSFVYDKILNFLNKIAYNNVKNKGFPFTDIFLSLLNSLSWNKKPFINYWFYMWMEKNNVKAKHVGNANAK